MPNWCNNELTLSHPDKAMIDRAIKAWNTGSFLQEFIPVPDDLMNTVSGFLGDGEEQKALELKQQNNLKKYGYNTWYDFCVNEWGTKWDIGKSNEYDNEPNRISDNEIHVYFDSAWSPPVNAYRKLEDMGFEVLAYYYEGGMGFYGQYTNGGDDCYQASSIKDIPAEYCQMFGIQEYEEDEERIEE
jgi:hypothetical protein